MTKCQHEVSIIRVVSRKSRNQPMIAFKVVVLLPTICLNKRLRFMTLISMPSSILRPFLLLFVFLLLLLLLNLLLSFPFFLPLLLLLLLDPTVDVLH